MKKTKTNYTVNFALMYLFHYISFSLISGQRQTFLIHVGYTLNQRSLIFTFIPVVTIFMQLFIGYLSDKHKTIKRIIVWVVGLGAITSYFFYSVEVQFYVFHFAIALLSQSFCIAITDLIDVWVLESQGSSRSRFGFIRAFGSAGWSVGGFLLATIVSNYGYPGLGMFTLLINVILLLVMITIADGKAQIDMEETREAIKFKDIATLFHDKHYVLAISIVFFVNMAKNMMAYMIIDKMIFLGGDVVIIGYREMIAAGIEIPLMLIGDRIHKKLGSMTMLTIGIGAYILQLFGYYMATSNNMIIVITLFQIVSVPFYQIALRYLLLEMSPAHLKTTGQMTGPAIVNGITGVAYPMFCALLVAIFSVNAPFFLAALFAVIGMIIAFVLYAQTKDSVTT